MTKTFLAPVVSVTGTSERHDLLWSLQPIANVIRLVGIDLDPGKSATKCRRCAFFVLGLSVLIFVGFTSSMHFIQGSSSKEKQGTFFYCWELLKEGTYLVSGILFPLAFFLAAFLKWATLWEKVEDMEQSVAFHKTFASRLRKVSAILIVFFGLLVLPTFFYQYISFHLIF